MRILVTGAAGFIGYHLSKCLIDEKHDVEGIDNLNNYYDCNLKFDRLNELGILKQNVQPDGDLIASDIYSNFAFMRLDISNRQALEKLFNDRNYDVVCHLAAQAGVRHSIDHPHDYIDSNIVGFLNVLECCRTLDVKHLIYASSSSVYGNNSNLPLRISDFVDKPISLYAATKKSNELMAHSYSHLYGLRTTGLRFFTVYGPWGRPDMAYYKFTECIEKNKPINVYNYGEMDRDFTYIDDIIKGISLIISSQSEEKNNYSLYNIGNNKTENLKKFIHILEKLMDKKADINFLPMQPGDVHKTWADVSDLINNFGYSPQTAIEDGLKKFVNWYKGYKLKDNF